MPFLAANLVNVLVLVLIYAFLYVVVRSMRSYLAAPTPSGAPASAGPPTPPPTIAALFVTDAAGDESRFGLDRDLLIGRGAGCDVRLTDDFASDRHARIGVDPDGPWIEDLDSTNGTTIDGAPIKGRVAVARGATIVAGRTKMVIR